ncbi:MAG: hypothetical protein IIA61_07250 [Candidatus Marinimicrobia bacterium]|nr:hypothetical protein [Candidatus Neomarinimicrobiota bacterium]
MKPVIVRSKMGLMPTLKTVGILSAYRHLPFAMEILSTINANSTKVTNNVNKLSNLVSRSIDPHINIEIK